jgi:4-hydroxybutyrate CoA-transferase
MYHTAEQALQAVQSGNQVYIQTAAACPQVLVDALIKRAPQLKDVHLYHLHTEGNAGYTEAQYQDSFHTHCFFIGNNTRKAVEDGRASYIPVFLSEVPLLFRRGIIPLDVALISVSLPDDHGFCSLGVSVDATKAAIDSSKVLIAQVNSFMPRTHGDAQIHLRDIDYLVEGNIPLPEFDFNTADEKTRAIGSYAAGLIEDRSSLQIGIGEIPNAILSCLEHHKDLGIHTEMFSDGILPLVEKGVITGRYKKKYREKIVSSFVMGTKRLYDFVHDNPLIAMLDCSYVNDSNIIKQNPKTVAINSAIEIDITGQVCADSIGTRMYSGVGGQMDFIRGASLSEGGKPIIAMPSTTAAGISRIVPTLKPGAGVVTTRAHVHDVVTEYGVASLYGRDLRQRAELLTGIAHPDHRESLEKAAFDRFGKRYY